MGQMTVLKIMLLSAFAVAAHASSRIGFDTGAPDDRDLKAKVTLQITDAGLPDKVALTDNALSQTHARPLFSRNRRPFAAKPQVIEQPVIEVEEEAAEQPSNSLPRRLMLLGTNAGGATASALVQNRENSEVRWLKVGETFDGWILSAATADQAAFVCREREGDDCEYRLILYSDAGEP